MIEIPLKLKYLIRFTAKFGGKKRKNSNSGNTGKTHRNKLRPRVISSKNSPEQFQQWAKAMGRTQ